MRHYFVSYNMVFEPNCGITGISNCAVVRKNKIKSGVDLSEIQTHITSFLKEMEPHAYEKLISVQIITWKPFEK